MLLGVPMQLGILFLVVVARCLANSSNNVVILTPEDGSAISSHNFLSDDSLSPVFAAIARDASPLDVEETVCQFLDDGVVGIIDATQHSNLVSQTIQQVANRHHVPRLTLNSYGKNNEFQLKLHPSEDYLIQMVRDIFHTMDLHSFTAIYDSLENLATLETSLIDADIDVNLKKISNDSNIERVLSDLAPRKEHNLVLAVSDHHLHRILQVAQTVGLNRPNVRYIITSLNPQINPEMLQGFDSSFFVPRVSNDGLTSETLELNLLQDALSTMAQGINSNEYLSSENNLCTESRAWSQGRDFMDILTKVEFEGKTGHVAFDSTGERKDAAFELMLMTKEKQVPIFNWKPSSGLTFSNRKLNTNQTAVNQREKRQIPHLRVYAHLLTPYVMLKKLTDEEDSQIRKTSKDRYEGLCVDILNQIATNLEFDYDLIEKDEPIGSFNENTGQWSGLVGHLVQRRADVIIGDITVTRQRSSVIDFTKPWHSLGVSILASADADHSFSMFAFLQPFSVDLWLILLIIFVCVTFLFFIIARISPIERSPPFKGELISWYPYTLLNSGWFIVTALFRLTPSQQPRALSTRFFSGIWWMFTLIIPAIYIVGLIGFLTAKSNEEPIESIFDLANQHKVKYGAVFEGSTWRNFETSMVPVYQRIYAGLVNGRKVYKPENIDEAIELVRESDGNYVFFMEEPSLDYIVNRQCDLRRIGGTVGSMRAFAFGLTQGSRYTSVFNDAILKMRESGELHLIYERWIKERNGGGACVGNGEGDSSDLAAQQMTTENLSGLFIVLVIGVVVAFIIAIVECCIRSATLAKEKKSSFCGEVSTQLKLAVIGPPSLNPNIVMVSVDGQ